MGLFSWLFGGDKAAKVAKLERRATTLKKDNPDAAIAALRESAAIQTNMGMHKTVLLKTRLRMATALYEAGRFDEAEAMLLDEYAQARKWVLGKREFDAADQQYNERLRTTKQYGGKIEGYERKRDIGENADFDRNLYCKAIYAKLRMCYERAKRFDKALPFAVAEAYAGYENQSHSMYTDNPQPDYKAVEKCLKKLGRPELMEQIQKLFAKYATKPDSTKCWRLIDEMGKIV